MGTSQPAGPLQTAGITQLLVCVCDSGPGLDTQKLDHLFEAFYTTKAGVTGMGGNLPVDHGGAWGRVWARANEPRGAIFGFELPIEHMGVVAA
jgi:C4-dicarboxylate-specific signal transduction histidine kinase